MLKLRKRQTPMPKPIFGMVIALGLLFLVTLGSVGGFVIFDRLNPPPLDKLSDLSVEVVDRDGALLRAYTNKAGQWRLGADLGSIDSEFINILLAYEDKSFWDHSGVDPRAILRASWQLLSNAGSFQARQPFPCSLPAFWSLARSAASKPNSGRCSALFSWRSG